MTMTLLVGGARSGKSSRAERLAAASGLPVVFVATAEARDEEMAARIARHREGRSETWATLETPEDIAGALASEDRGSFVVLDCLTLWLSNVLEDEDTDILTGATEIADLLATFAGSAAISNEVGSGIVPADAVSRRYRDLLGAINATFRARADRSWLCVAGGVIPIVEPEP